MFDSLAAGELDLLTGSELAAAISGNHAELLARECRVLELACAWADLHTREPVEYSPLVERARFFGGPGTPAIGEFCVVELGTLQGTGPLAAQALMADAWICGIGCPGCGPRCRPVRSGRGRLARWPSGPGRCRGRRARTWMPRSRG